MNGEDDGLPRLSRRERDRVALEHARQLARESECHHLTTLYRCLEGLRAYAVDAGIESLVELPPATGLQAEVDQVIARWRAEHDQSQDSHANTCELTPGVP